MGVMRPELVMKSIVPVVMAGVLGIYGLIIAVIISTGSELEVLEGAGEVVSRSFVSPRAFFLRRFSSTHIRWKKKRNKLRTKNFSPSQKNSQPDRRQALLLLRRLRPPGFGARLRARGPRRGHGDRRRRRRRSPRQRAAAQAVRGHDPDSDFCGSLGSVRADRWDHPGVQGRDGGARRRAVRRGKGRMWRMKKRDNEQKKRETGFFLFLICPFWTRAFHSSSLVVF